VEVFNNTLNWKTRTSFNGEFRVYLPTGSYTLVVYGNGTDSSGTPYKRHTFPKMNVTAGQMATPKEAVNVELSMGNFALNLDPPAMELGGRILGGIDATTKTISGTVNLEAVLVEVYDVAKNASPAKPLASAKPAIPKGSTIPTFSVKLPAKLQKVKLQLREIDINGNAYVLTMPNEIP